jgi:hypothetical protein
VTRGCARPHARRAAPPPMVSRQPSGSRAELVRRPEALPLRGRRAAAPSCPRAGRDAVATPFSGGPACPPLASLAIAKARLAVAEPLSRYGPRPPACRTDLGGLRDAPQAKARPPASPRQLAR